MSREDFQMGFRRFSAFDLSILPLNMLVTIPGKGVLVGAALTDSITKNPKCHRFSRVPYALSPTGARRWRKPEPLPISFSYGTETNPGKYKIPCSPCPQPSKFGVRVSDEDCLQLNIYVPIGTPPRGGWPVFFYIRKAPFSPLSHPFHPTVSLY